MHKIAGKPLVKVTNEVHGNIANLNMMISNKARKAYKPKEDEEFDVDL